MFESPSPSPLRPRRGKLRRVFLDDSCMDYSSPVKDQKINGDGSTAYTPDGTTDIEKPDFRRSHARSMSWCEKSHVESSEDEEENASAVGVVEDSEDNEEESSVVSENMVPESPSIAPIDVSDVADGSRSPVDAAMESIASIVLESEDDVSVLDVVEDSVAGNLPEVDTKPKNEVLSVSREIQDSTTAGPDGGQGDTIGTSIQADYSEENRRNELCMKLDRLHEAAKVMDKLPDKGARLLAEIRSVQNELENQDGTVTKAQSNIQAKIEPSASGDGETLLVRATLPVAQASLDSGDSKVLASGDMKPKPAPKNPWEAKKTEDYWNKKYAIQVDAHRLYAGKMNEARQNEAKIVTQDAIQTLHKTITSCPAEATETKDPTGLLVPLMEHQRQALTWLLWRESQQPAGGILADDMGLGKTLTMISLILAKKYSGVDGKEDDQFRKRVLANQKLIASTSSLVVCPASIIHQWEKEIARHVKPGKLSVLVYHGQKRETTAQRLARYDVVLTTYGTVGSELSEKKKESESDSDDDDGWTRFKKKSPMVGVAWERIILDEAHQIRNHTTGQAQACCKLPAAARWCLTGTPLQNQLKDLFSLLKFLRYYPFDEYAVWKDCVEQKSEQAKQRLNTIIKGILLRRTKEQASVTTGKALVSLPPKRYEVELLDFTPLERSVYERMFAASRLYVMEFLGNQEGRLENRMCQGMNQARLAQLQQHCENPFKGGPKRFNEAKESTGGGNLEILVMLLRLRQACVHFALTKDGVNVESLAECGVEAEPAADLVKQLGNMSLLEDDDDMDEMGGAGDKTTNEVNQLFEKTTMTTKIRSILRRLDYFRLHAPADGTIPKFVLVSQWVQVLEMIAVHLKKRGIAFTSITGSIPPRERSERTEKFNDLKGGPQVMLLSISAGGVGLNLIGGNHLFVIDLHWNPALEKQACDRIYRVGQTRNVFIHKFVVKTSMEERVQQLQEFKLKLAESVLSGAGAKGMNKLSIHDLKFLFGLSSNVPQYPGATVTQSLPSLPKY